MGLRQCLERFQAKWTPVRVKKTRQIKNLEPRFDSIETEKALGTFLSFEQRNSAFSLPQLHIVPIDELPRSFDCFSVVLEYKIDGFRNMPIAVHDVSPVMCHHPALRGGCSPGDDNHSLMCAAIASWRDFLSSLSRSLPKGRLAAASFKRLAS
jgi:hypothetical protein